MAPEHTLLSTRHLRHSPYPSHPSRRAFSPATTAVSWSPVGSSAGSPPPESWKSKQAAGPFTMQGELYPYVKGKKVTPEQLSELLQSFNEDDNPSKEARLALGNRLQMSFKAVSIWFQNERANVKKGRARTVAPTDAASSLTSRLELPAPTFISARRPPPGSHSDRTNSWIVNSQPRNERFMDSDDETTADVDEVLSPESQTSSLPEVRVHPPEDADIDPEGLSVARILVGMKYAQ